MAEIFFDNALRKSLQMTSRITYYRNSGITRCSIFLAAVFLQMTLFALTNNCLAVDKKIAAEQFYQKGIALYKIGELDSAISTLKKAIQANQKLAKAHNQLGLIYTEQETIHSRYLANIEFDKAIQLDWNNPEYRFNRAMLFLKMDMTGAAVHDLENVIKANPDSFMAYYHLGLIQEKIAMRYRDMINPHQEAIIYFRNFAESDQEKAVYYFNKAIALNPKYTETYYHLGLLYYEFGDLDEMISLLEKAVKVNAADKNNHLFLGFAYHQDEQFASAQKEFDRAIQLMSPEERGVFNSIDHILSPDQKKSFANDSTTKKQDFLESFWKQKDPVFLTDYNERKLEHYSRIAYANLRYSIPKKNIEGWQTDPGKVLIRYGKPNTMYRTRPELDDVKAGDHSMPLNTSKEFWLYPDFQFVFEDRFLSNRYEFVWGDTPENDYRNIYERLITEKPDLYKVETKKEILEIAAEDLVEFKGNADRTAVILNYALPADSIYLVLQEDNWQTRLKRGIFLLDQKWNKRYDSTKELYFPESLTTRFGDIGYFLDKNEFEISPGNYHFVLEIYDMESDRRGTVRKEIDIRSFSKNELQLSDILLASNIATDSLRYNIHRNELKIEANPFKKYFSNTPIFMYYEIYNLTKAADGLTSFRVDYTLSGNQKKVGSFKKFLEKIKLFNFSGDITTTYHYEGTSTIENQYQQLTLNRNQNEDLILTVTVTDLNNATTVSTQTELRIEAIP